MCEEKIGEYMLKMCRGEETQKKIYAVYKEC